MTWAPEWCQRRVDPGKHGGEQQRRTAGERERAKWRSWREVSTHQLTELFGDRVLMPCLSLSETKLGDG